MRRLWLSLAASAACFGVSGCLSLEQPQLVRAGTPVSAIMIHNGTPDTVTDLRIGICGEMLGAGPDYGLDRLEGRKIAPDARLSFPASPGCYNIASMTSSGRLLSSGTERFHIVIVPDDLTEPGQLTIR